MPKRKSATLIPVSEDIIDDVAALAERVGKPIRKLVEEILSEGVKSYSYGIPISEAMREYVFFLEAKRLGFTLIPVSIINKLSNSHNEEWLRAGKLLASMLRAQGNTNEEDMVKALKSVAMDASEILLVKGKNDTNRITIVALSRNKNGIKALLELVKGVLIGLGFHVEKEEIDEGICTIEYTRKEHG